MLSGRELPAGWLISSRCFGQELQQVDFLKAIGRWFTTASRPGKYPWDALLCKDWLWMLRSRPAITEPLLSISDSKGSIIMIGDEGSHYHLWSLLIVSAWRLRCVPSTRFRLREAALDYLAESRQIPRKFHDCADPSEGAIRKLTENKTAGLRFCFLHRLGYDLLSAERLWTGGQFSSAKTALKSPSFPWKETRVEIVFGLDWLREGRLPTGAWSSAGKKDSLISRYGNPQDKGLIAYLMAVN